MKANSLKPKGKPILDPECRKALYEWKFSQDLLNLYHKEFPESSDNSKNFHYTKHALIGIVIAASSSLLVLIGCIYWYIQHKKSKE